jgi:DNA mismatch repair protein MutS
MALVKEYFELTEKYKKDYGENTILLMMVGSFFEVYGTLNKTTQQILGSSLTEFCRICELNMAEKNSFVGMDSVVLAGFKDFMIEKYVRKLQEAGYTAVVYVQVVQPAGNITRECSAIFSPGTFFQTETTSLNNNVMCVWIQSVNPNFLFKSKQVVVGIANVNIFTGETSIFQYKEPFVLNPTTFDELERFVSIYNPSESIIVSNLTQEEVDAIIGFSNISSKTIHKVFLAAVSSSDAKDFSNLQKAAINCEKQVYQKEVLQKFYIKRFYDMDVFMQNFYDNDIATQAFCFLLDFVYKHSPSLVNKVKEPVFENCSDRLVLANHTLKQLNMIENTGYHDYTGKYSSVSKMLNECLTAMGKRLFSHHLLNPTTNIDFLQKEYDMTSYLLDNMSNFDNQLKISLSQIKDLSKWGRQIILLKISPKTFCIMKSNLLIVKSLFQLFDKNEAVANYLKDLPNLKDLEMFCDRLIIYIEKRLVEEVAIEVETQFEINFFKKGFNEELDVKSAELKDAEDQLEAIRFYLNSFLSNKAGEDMIKIHETEKNTFNLLATSRRCKMLEEALPADKRTVRIDYRSNNEPKSVNIVLGKGVFEYVKQGASNNFIQNNVIGMLCRKICELKQQMKALVASAFAQFVSNFNSDYLDGISDYVAHIDVMFTKASLAKKYHYCRPVIDNTSSTSTKSFVSFKGLRHCLIEHLQQNEIYVTNDMDLGFNSVDGVLLYGTNAVGKTSFIRAIGIAVIMAQAGLFVPCSSFIYKPYKYIFSRIIGNDNIFKGLSTFAVEMSELRTILRLANENSLVLGDELCSGTENTSAISIFVAGISFLFQRKCSFIFATHLHEVVGFDEISSLKTVVYKHMAVTYDKEKDLLIYDRKLREGAGNNMYGLEVCKSLGLPEDFLELAYGIRMKYNPETASILHRKSSHFNARKIVNMCENCGEEMGTEVHHLEHQSSANEDGFIQTEDGSIFHKNNAANLLTVCEKCHRSFHDSGTAKKNSKHGNADGESIGSWRGRLRKAKTSQGHKIVFSESPDI